MGVVLKAVDGPARQRWDLRAKASRRSGSRPNATGTTSWLHHHHDDDERVRPGEIAWDEATDLHRWPSFIGTAPNDRSSMHHHPLSL